MAALIAWLINVSLFICCIGAILAGMAGLIKIISD